MNASVGWSIPYDDFRNLLLTTELMKVARSLQEQLPYMWREAYTKNSARPTNIVRFQCNTFEYFYDFYTELEKRGETQYSQITEDRLVAVIGTSAPTKDGRDPTRLRGWVGPTQRYIGQDRDKGHYIAHYIGGGLDVNVFSQDRRLNRGWSEQGRTYRAMEKYCYEHPRTLCFSRPIYDNATSVPHWLEFGLLKANRTLWVEVFDNGTSDYRTADLRIDDNSIK